MGKDDTQMDEEKKEASRKPSPEKKREKRPFLRDDVWMVNMKFKSQKKKHYLPEAKFEIDAKQDSSSVDAERKETIEASIVRVMKSRKNYKYQDLISDVMKILLKFSPDAKHVRQGIEDLIKKDYLERD